ncbi:LuxR family transcriptional regulator [Massilia sp. MS-15]|uniref:helix-turn-helix transcriptional regulator n=1 Tax=Massilia sp. MS-15 TaxID=2878200 RepID=UPI001CD4582E|nr:LuxR family transcriptional regulator [Massilia sp. MS-15]MCA1248052.1 LuxR family transcriptional regulator [Massilia sp. MS-15]
MIDNALLIGLLEAGDEQSWTAQLVALANAQGFPYVLFGLLPSRQTRFSTAYVRTNYPAAWRARYSDAGFVHIDPTVAHCLKSTLPLVWSRATFEEALAGAMYEEACAHGLRSGVTLPVHGPQGELGLISFASEHAPDAACARRVAAALPVLALIRDYAFASAARFHEGALEPGMPRLTRRELEVLRWVMLGKSSWEIARITACSEATINFHLANVRQKFGVNTRQQAVVIALGLGLLSTEEQRR